MGKYAKVTMYQSGDGKLHHTITEANDYHRDQLCEMFENIIKRLQLTSLKISERDKICEALYAERDNIRNYIERYDLDE